VWGYQIHPSKINFTKTPAPMTEDHIHIGGQDPHKVVRPVKKKKKKKKIVRELV
jgi:dihydroorotase